MKKVGIALLVIMLIAALCGLAYSLSDGFKKVPWEKGELKPTETNILTESQALLKNHASITFGSGDSAWTISTADKVEPIYIDDLRAPGKGFNIGHSNSGGENAGIPLESDISISGANISSIIITGSAGNGYHSNYAILRKDGSYIWASCAYSIYENILCSFSSDGSPLDSEISRIEAAIISEVYKPGDNYLLGSYQFIFQFQDTDKYGEESLLDMNSCGAGLALFVNIPVYYRVK